MANLSFSGRINGFLSPMIFKFLILSHRTATFKGSARPVWFGCDLGYLLRFISSSPATQWTQAVLKSCPNDRHRRERLGEAATIGWCLWKAHNEWVFNQFEVNPMQVIRQASFLRREGCSVVALADSSPVSVNSAVQICNRWTPPPHGMFKVNCDTSFASKGKKTSLAVILQDWKGHLIDGVVSIVHTSSVTQGEARAIWLACMFLQALGLSNFQVESDCKSVIDLCVSELVPPWECLAYLSDIRSTGQASSFSFSWVPRAANSVAHWLASSRIQDALPLDWIRNPPMYLRNLLVSDSLVA
ncbi:uncharacterized protein LOC114309167 [Camellia sinensis]|uniref:uncharacterized protein LOC114309167 n=1 Tax=Camellia sinensis TaxID=4442 RepID=UPI001036598C|nr:uncharacterized protein LOC114309167 [Camellia sinensis]